MSKFIYAWNEASEGAKALAGVMGIKRIRHERSRFVGRPNKKVINWGSSTLGDEVLKCKILNKPEYVNIVSDKLLCFNMFEARPDNEVPRHPQVTTDHEVARQWLIDGKQVCARTRLRGSGAEGLVIMGPGVPQEWTQAPLYTLYIPKKDEYRIHIVNGVVIHQQRKAKKLDFEGERNTQIRNLANGYVFAAEGFETPEDVLVQSKLAMAASGLDFGAVDCIYNKREQKAYVLEINSAPGLAPTVCAKYAEALSAL